MTGWKVLTIGSSSALVLVALHCGGSAPRADGAPAAPGHAGLATARQELETARRYLDQATADRGGHREQAIHLVDRAMWEIDGATGATGVGSAQPGPSQAPPPAPPQVRP